MAHPSGDPRSPEVRPLGQHELERAAAVVEEAFAGMPYLTRAIEVLRAAAAGPDNEHRGVMVVAGETVEGVAVFGMFAGSSGAGRLHFLALRPGDRQQAAAAVLIDAVRETLRREHARFLLAEIPTDPRLASVCAALEAAGFESEATIDDFFNEGVGLSFLRAKL